MNGSELQPAPARISVAGREIDEAEIAREMQHHRADSPQRSRTDAARAHAVRELLRLEIERLDLVRAVECRDGETSEEACIRVLLEREAGVAAPDDAACRQYYEDHRAVLRRPDRVLLRHILLAAPEETEERRRARALGEELIAELGREPGRFTELAARHSACPSRDDGGDLGWIERGDTTPEFERQVFALPPGLAPLTVESRWGHHVVWIEALEPGTPLDYEEAAPRIAAWLEAQARQHAMHQYLHRLAARYDAQGLGTY